MKIIKYTPAMRSALEGMFVQYFLEDLHCDIPEDIIRGRLFEFIIENAAESICHISIALNDNTPVGFSIYQIDSVKSDWCKRPGWGFIREFFISSEYRGKGFGRLLADHTEQQLLALGATQLYLTSDDTAGFWEHCGYRNTHEICSNDLEILTK